MDIKPIGADASQEERDAVDAVLGPPQSAWDGGERGSRPDAHVAFVGGHDSRARRHLLLPALRALQSRAGWISEGGLGYVCDRLNLPPAEAWGVATFYALLATSPRPARVIHVCDDIACKCRGADAVIAELERTVGPALDSRSDTRDPAPGWLRSPCLGMCDQSPAAFVTMAGEYPVEQQVGSATADDVIALINPPVGPTFPPSPKASAGHRSFSEGGRSGIHPTFRSGIHRPAIRQPLPELRLLRRVGRVDPTSLTAYLATRGFEALARARGGIL